MPQRGSTKLAQIFDLHACLDQRRHFGDAVLGNEAKAVLQNLAGSCDDPEIMILFVEAILGTHSPLWKTLFLAYLLSPKSKTENMHCPTTPGTVRSRTT